MGSRYMTEENIAFIKHPHPYVVELCHDRRGSHSKVMSFSCVQTPDPHGIKKKKGVFSVSMHRRVNGHSKTHRKFQVST